MFKKDKAFWKNVIIIFVPFFTMAAMAVFFLNKTFVMLEQKNADVIKIQMQKLLEELEEEIALAMVTANDICIDSSLSIKNVEEHGNLTIDSIHSLQQYRGRLEFCSMVYLGYPNRSLLTDQGVCSIDAMIDKELQLTDKSKERFSQLMESTESICGVLLETQQNKKYLVIQAYYEKTKSIQEKRVGFVFDVNLMEDTLLKILGDIDCLSFVMWENEIMAWENNLSQEVSDSRLEELCKTARDNQSVPGYSLIVCNGQRLDMSMYIILDNSVIKGELIREEIKIFLIGGVIFAGLMLFIWLYEKYRYRLLYEIKQLATSKHPEIRNNSLQSDYELIRLALEKDYDTIQQQSDNLEFFRKRAKEQLFRLLLSGAPLDEINLNELMDNYDMSAHGPYYCVIHLQISGNGKPAAASVVLRRFPEVWAHCMMSYEGMYILVLGISLEKRDDDHDRRIELIRKIEKELSKDDYMCGYATCGLLYEELSEVKSSHQEAQLMMQKFDTKDAEKEKAIIFFDEFAYVSKQVPHNIADLLAEFKDSLDKQNVNDAERLIDTLTSRKDNKKELIIYVQYKIVQILMDFVYERGESMEEIRELSQFVGAESPEFGSMVKKLIKDKLFGTPEKKVITDEMIVQYINENLTNSEISVKSVANYFQISERSVNRIMRRATDKTYKEYINSLRLAKANELLVLTDMDVQAIAKSVGYYDVSSFGKLYKQNFGVTPTEYRNNARRDDNVY